MGPIGVPEMLFILVVALLIFGPKRLPEFGRTIGKALGEFRRATHDLKRSIDVEVNAPEPPRRPPPTAPPAPAVPRGDDTSSEAGESEAESTADDTDDEDTTPA